MSRDPAPLSVLLPDVLAELEARQAAALAEIADALWDAEPDPCARYDRDRS